MGKMSALLQMGLFDDNEIEVANETVVSITSKRKPSREHRKNKVYFESLVANADSKESRIGWLFWYIIAERQTDKDEANNAFMQSALPKQYGFPAIRPADVYRRASKSIEGRVELFNSAKVELLVRDVWHDKNEIVRHLVVENRDLNGHRLSYDTKAAILRFDHNQKNIDSTIISSDKYISDAVLKFEQNFYTFRNTYDGSAKRRVVRNVLNDLAATSLKESGGVYLVPRQNEETLFQLISFINALPGCRAYKMPVENTEEARDMVRDVVTNKAETILCEIRAALQAEMLPEQNAKGLLERARQIKREVVLYQEILKDSIGTLETDVEVLEAQMMNILENIV